MENNAVFEVDATLDRTLSSSPPPYRKRQPDDGGTKVAHGKTEAHKDRDYERTPLLSRDYESDFGTRLSTPDENDGRSPPAWSGERDFEGKAWWQRPSVLWLLPPFLLYTMAFGGVVVPKLNLTLSLICRDYLSDRATDDPNFQFLPVDILGDNPQCRIPEVQSLVSKFTLYTSLIAGSLTVISSPKLGSLSDRYGRTKVIAMTTFGMLLSEVINIMLATYSDIFSVNWLLLGTAFDGICGSFIACMAISHAYASDCTSPPQRAVAFAYFHGCLFTGIALGPITAGYIIKATGQIVTIFYIAFGAHLIYLTCLLFVIPESLTKERQLSARAKTNFIGEAEGWAWSWTTTLKAIRNGGGLFAPLSILWPTGDGSNRAVRRNLVLLAAVDTTMFGVAMGSITVVIIYSEYMFGWGNLESSVFVSIVNVCRVTILLVVLPLVIRLVRGRTGSTPQRNSGSDGLDLAIIRTAIAFDMLGYIGYATARTGSLLIVSGAVAAVGGMGSPTLQSALTKHVPPDRTGQLLGAMGLLHALARIVGPTIFNLIYAATVGKFSQTVFVCLAATFGIAFTMSWFIRPHVYFDEPDHPDSHPQPGAVDGEIERV